MRSEKLSALNYNFPVGYPEGCFTSLTTARHMVSFRYRILLLHSLILPADCPTMTSLEVGGLGIHIPADVL